ncbi:hypothetical protein [uncultured Duncaniella sp.]|uniref:hypothetical protein n=1 Tax=uncultured Duncaniella sp. TaxID=2768039 RepID=UPI0025AFB420|nr:hypothetical protein [uncultured Duncaniella sp.]
MIVKLTATDGSPVEFVDEVIGSGAMKDVYFSPDKSYVVTRVRDKNFMFFNQAKDIEYWAAFQGRLIYLYSLVLIPEDKLPV